VGADGSKGPRPFSQRTARTTFLRVPADDWIAVKRGVKREFRGGPGTASAFHGIEPPTPVVAYRVRRGEHEAKLMVLERAWQEPLGAISEESLAAEGFESFAEFRRYWIRRTRRRFMPTRRVWVYRVRPWSDADMEPLALRLFMRLYGEHLDRGAGYLEQGQLPR
jgi:hypothetical protein